MILPAILPETRTSGVYTQYHAQSTDLLKDRVQMGAGKPSIWPSLNRAWDTLASQVVLDEGDVSTRSMVTSFAKFTRNLVAAVPSNQQNAL